ncbi:hypothetical protein N8T08_002336 [Aspergillus melleus]|uniref:Uncharacterized protein n=1 Tax=Aspergillus melleus TaxID=138277 RepID=A0ACC3B9G1_9EURO|nr:hypothetical protein N8T08_002336 [Aspergillus melleus]
MGSQCSSEHKNICVLDHCHIVNSPAHADAAVNGLKEAGIRATFCYGLYENLVLPGQGQAAAVFDLDMRKNDALRVQGRGIDDMVADLQVARALGVRITTMHVAMGHYDTRHARVVQNLADADLLAPDLVFSHGASFTDSELNAITRVGAGIVGTPDTELQMGMGYPVIFKTRDARCRRGIDNASFVSSPPATLKRTTADILRMGTIDSAEVIHLENLVGWITPGKKTDLVLFKCDDIDTVPVLDPVGTVVFHTSPANIDTVIVGGRIVKKDGKFVGVDWANLRWQVEERSRWIVAEAARVDTPIQREQWSRAFGV